MEVLALVKKTHTPVNATSVPSVTNTLAFLLRPAAAWAWVTVEEMVVVVVVEVVVEGLGAGVGVAEDAAATPAAATRKHRINQTDRSS